MSHATVEGVKTRPSREPFRVELTPERVALVTYDLPGENVNTLRADFTDAFSRIVDEVEQNPDIVAAVLRSGKRESFIVGADIEMLQSIHSADDAVAMVQRGHQAIGRLADTAKPFVAAVHGDALGGGFEVALACTARVLSHSRKTALGFPEVRLGLLPGLSGLQRLAAIAGLQVALDYGLTGKNMRPDQARKLGVADDVVPRSILDRVAVELALELSRSPRRERKRRLDVTRLALEHNPLGRGVLFRKARAEVRKSTGGHYPAPERIIDVLDSYARDGFEASQEVEARAFGELLTTDVSKNLISIFFAQTALKKDPGVDHPDVVAREVTKIGVLGAGLMGAGISYVSLDNGIEVRMKDRDAPAVGRGLKAVTGLFDEQLRRRRITPSERLERVARLSVTTDYSGMRHLDLVIEAVFEDLELKKRVLREVEDACAPGVIFASNTSSIPIRRIAEGARAPENVVGMHYFSPVHKMPLLEVVRAPKTSDEAVATAVAVGKRQKKTVIVVNDGVGFYTSRVLAPYMNEASYLLTEGVAVEIIDRAMTSWGWPVGPMTLIDEVGIDVAAHVGPIMLGAFGDRMAPPATIQRLVDDGRKGRKNEKGFYLYGAAADKKGKRVDESVYEALGLQAPDPDRDPPVSFEEIQNRCNLQFINEAMHCLGEGILRSPRDGDVGAIFGLGFPPFLGGPFRYIDAVGPVKLLAQIEAYHDRFGARWTPAPALIELAQKLKKLHP